MKDTLKVGIIGCGGISQVHLLALQSLPDADVVAFCDIDIKKAMKMADTYGAADAACYTDFHEVLQRPDIDVIHIAAPHYLHADMAIEALDAGKYVLCEKPMDISKAKAKQMIDADIHNRLGIIYQNRYNPSTVKAREIIESGELGKLLCMRACVTWHRDIQYYSSGDWRGKWATEGGGVLINQSIHTTDLLYHLGGAFAQVKGTISRDLLADIIEVEDTAHVVVRHADGKISLLFATNDFLLDDMAEIKLFFEKGVLLLNTEALWLLQDGDMKPLVTPRQAENGGKAVYGNGHDAIVHDFYSCIRDGRKFWIDAAEAYPSIWAVLSTYESSKTDRWIEFDR